MAILHFSPLQSCWSRLSRAATLLALLVATTALAGEAVPPPPDTAWQTLSLSTLGRSDKLQLQGVRNTEYIDFGVPRDQLITDSHLELVFTPSPALSPTLSHLRVYLNEELMGVVPITAEELGRQTRHRLPLDPAMITDFNRIRVELVAHYDDRCEDLANSALWVDISKQTAVSLNARPLTIRNDLSLFPEPFYDSRGHGRVELPMVFAGSPQVATQKAAAILASYFGSKAQWRGVRFPVSYDKIPADRHSIVFATNDARPAFLKHLPPVDGPVVQVISHPDQAHVKALLVLGRNGSDLIKAATALAIGNPLFRGDTVAIDEIIRLQPRVPYDAPNWTRIDRPVAFSELVQYPGQLETAGMSLRPIDLEINLPPDLFVWRNVGIPAQLRYRYTAPPALDNSRLSITLNGQFIRSYPLREGQSGESTANLRVPLAEGLLRRDEALSIPALKVGSRNQLRFGFSFPSTVSSMQGEVCHTSRMPEIHAAIDDSSSIDFSGFPHYLAMPNLSAYADAGFPFSRMADLSETIVVTAPNPDPQQLSALLEAMGLIGIQTGYPGYGVRIMTRWEDAIQQDADILLIGPMPASLREREDMHLLLDQTRARLKLPRLERNAAIGDVLDPLTPPTAGLVAQVGVRAEAPMAAVLGMQAPRFPDRSVVALLASADDDYALLRNALGDVGKRNAMEGSVVLIRESGVAGSFVGERYYVGELNWWQWIWYHISEHPVWIVVVSLLTCLLVAVLLVKVMQGVARRRLHGTDVR